MMLDYMSTYMKYRTDLFHQEANYKLFNCKNFNICY